MRKNILIYLRVGMSALLTILTAATVYIAVQNTRSAAVLAEQSIENTALALSYSAEKALRIGAAEEMRDIFSDRVVAYALVADSGGRILFHTNRRLEGKRLNSGEIDKWPRAEVSSGKRIMLGTGSPAYEFNFGIGSPEGAPRLLRLVLQAAPADAIRAGADRIWWVLSGVLAILWVAGFLLERILSRYLKLQAEIEKQERLAVIGRMTAILAHEIRNTLGSIKGFSQWIAERTEPLDGRKNAIDFVIRGAERLEKLVRDLLDFSRVESYRIEFLDLRPAVEEAIGISASVWRGRIEMELPTGLQVAADRERLHRVLINCFRNALEAMGQDGLLRVSAGMEKNRVGVVIEDSGTGIRPADRPRLFTPFFTTKVGGTGLGLAYSQKVINGMGGEIRIENRVKTPGAVVRIHLPGRKAT